MKCALCYGGMEKSTVTLPFDMENGDMVVVKHVPAYVCKQCGDSFIEIEIFRELEKIVETARKDGVTLGFIEYKEAA